MINIQDSKTNRKEKMMGDSYKPLSNGEERMQRNVRRKSKCCCCIQSRQRSKSEEYRRLAWEDSFKSIRLTSMLLSFVMLGGALYLDNLITATPNILMDDPNSPDSEVLLVPVEELSFSSKEIKLKVPVATTISSKGYLQRTVTYEACGDYDNVCKTLSRDGTIWWFACIIGIALTLPPMMCSSFVWPSIKKFLSLLPALAITFVLAIWWLEAWLTLSTTKTVSYPFYSIQANATIMTEMTFEDKRMLPGYSLCLASLTGIALLFNFAMIAYS